MASSSLWREEMARTRDELINVHIFSQANEKSLGYVNATCNIPYPQFLDKPLFEPQDFHDNPLFEP